MKLFNEEQVKEAYNRGHMDGKLNNTDYSITDGFKPIKLPSDNEIENIIISKYPHSVGVGVNHLIKSDERIGFEEGAKWMKEQILNQNK